MKVVSYHAAGATAWDQVADHSGEAWLFHRAAWVEIEARFAERIDTREEIAFDQATASLISEYPFSRSAPTFQLVLRGVPAADYHRPTPCTEFDITQLVDHLIGSVTGLGSAAMAADARQTDFCTYLSGILLGGLLLNALFGLWWADPAAGLVMVPIIAKEGIAGWQGKACCDNCN